MSRLSRFAVKSAVLAAAIMSTGSMAHGALVAYYNFNDASNPSVVADNSFNGHTGTAIGATYTGPGGGWTGAAGDRSMNFDGSFDRVIMNDGSTALDFVQASQKVTIGLRILGDPAQPRQQTMFNASGVAGGGDPRQILVHLPWDNSNVYFDTGGCCGTDVRLNGATAASNFEGPEWDHWVFVKDGNDKRIYVNNTLFLQQVGTATGLIGNIEAFVLGATNLNGDQSYLGRVDDFVIFDHALSAGEVGTLFQVGGAAFVVPEPASASLLVLGAAALMRRRRLA